MKSKQQVKAFLKKQVEHLKGIEGFLMGIIASKFSDLDALADLIVNEALSIDSSENLVAFAICSPEDGDATLCLLCTPNGIHVIQDYQEGVYEYEYFIEFSDVDVIEFKKKGFFEPSYHLNIYQAGKNKRKGWFFKGLPKMLEQFKMSAENAFLNYEESEPNNSQQAVSIDKRDAEKRIKALLDQKLITQKDYESKIKKLN